MEALEPADRDETDELEIDEELTGTPEEIEQERQRRIHRGAETMRRLFPNLQGLTDDEVYAGVDQRPDADLPTFRDLHEAILDGNDVQLENQPNQDLQN